MKSFKTILNRKKWMSKGKAKHFVAGITALAMVGAVVLSGKTVVDAAVTDTVTGTVYEEATDGLMIEDGVVVMYTGAASEVVVPEGVTEIGMYAFGECGNVVSVKLPSTLKTIGMNAFSECVRLKNIEIPDNVTTIGDGAFWYCMQLMDEAGFVIIEDVLYYYAGVETDVVIPRGVKAISSFAFYDGNDITSVIIPEGVLSIGERAFDHCKYLENITFSGTVETIGDYAFSYCEQLTEIVIPESVENIGANVFDGCSDELVVKGEPGSAAEDYAISNGYPFREDDVEAVKPSQSPVPQQSDKPVQSPVPQQSGEPVQSPSSQQSDKPMQSLMPQQSNKPGQSPVPQVTPNPQVTQNPQASQEPEYSGFPDGSENPQQSENVTTYPGVSDDPQEPQVVLGDVDEDGSIDVLDVWRILRGSVQLDALTNRQIKAADYNKNGMVEADDALLLLNKLVGKF